LDNDIVFYEFSQKKIQVGFRSNLQKTHNFSQPNPPKKLLNFPEICNPTQLEMYQVKFLIKKHFDYPNFGNFINKKKKFISKRKSLAKEKQ
jgi:hypothetical protein